MWVRKQIDINWTDLVFGIGRSICSRDRESVQQALERAWSVDEDGASDAFACLSIRTGFDLLLDRLGWPPGSELLMSAVTIGDMVRIVEHHDLVPVPVDLDVRTLAPKLDAIRRAITPKTKAIVVAHLFGSRVPMEPIMAIAREHGLMVIEDCAQAFEGDGYRGHEDADVSMFSFGPIKTATALGGAILRVRDRAMLEQMQARYREYPAQSRTSYCLRLLKFGGIKILSTRWFLGAVAKVSRWIGRDHDGLASHVARGFAGPGFFDRIRKQPAAPLLAMIQRQIRNCTQQKIELRASRGRLLIELLNGSVVRPGAGAEHHSHWVFPILVDEPRKLMEELWRAGFDATQGQSHCVVDPLNDGDGLVARDAHCMVAQTVFLPFSTLMTPTCLERMAEIVRAECPRPFVMSTEHGDASHTDSDQTAVAGPSHS